MSQGYTSMPMPTPHYSSQAPRPPYPGNTNTTSNPTDSVMSTLSIQLDQADQSELQELHDKEEKIHQILNEITEVKQVQAEREMQVAGNRSLAEYNMDQGTRLKKSKQRLAQLYQQLNEQSTRFDENKNNLDSLSSQYNPDTIMALLQTSVAQIEETSEKTADGFLDGDVTVEDFLEKYTKERSELHIRRTKVDKLKELMRHRNMLTS
ncbi:vacuolar protein sorting-associated protein 37C-like [Dendronephthya gigantea]|uniref:vacuolar protein sorting-associated protein 37C-like n=1 Tax=Dendronephthya gigantea TaxID=151771 RepID=UPI001069461C|nr:vacuolar protein sorting-associated protein 37C-like [Dendronephthya gigantea]